MNLCELANICTTHQREVFGIVCVAIFIIGFCMCEDMEDH